MKFIHSEPTREDAIRLLSLRSDFPQVIEFYKKIPLDEAIALFGKVLSEDEIKILLEKRELK